MRTGISPRAYGQSDPLVAYKKEAHEMYESLMATIRRDVMHLIYHYQLTPVQPAPPLEVARSVPDGAGAPRGAEESPIAASAQSAPVMAPVGVTAVTGARNLLTNRDDQVGDGNGHGNGNGSAPRRRGATATVAGPKKVGRNEPCPCGSGRKYKKCHGAWVGIGRATINVLVEPVLPDDETTDEMIATLGRWRREDRSA